jgi:phospholipase C
MRITFAQRAILLAPALCLGFVPGAQAQQDKDDATTKTPIKHVVVIFQENVSFDHYFGTYPHAVKNTNGTQY